MTLAINVRHNNSIWFWINPDVFFLVICPPIDLVFLDQVYINCNHYFRETQQCNHACFGPAAGQRGLEHTLQILRFFYGVDTVTAPGLYFVWWRASPLLGLQGSSQCLSWLMTRCFVSSPQWVKFTPKVLILDHLSTINIQLVECHVIRWDQNRFCL